MIVASELTTNRITRIIENMLIWLPWGRESATDIATITNVRNSVTENDVLSPEPIGKINTNKLTMLTRIIGSTSVIHRNRGFLLIYISNCK